MSEFVESPNGSLGGGLLKGNPSTAWSPGASKYARAGRMIGGKVLKPVAGIALPFAIHEGAMQMAKAVDNIDTAPAVTRTQLKQYTMDQANKVPSSEKMFTDPTRNRPTGSISYNDYKGNPIDVKQELPKSAQGTNWRANDVSDEEFDRQQNKWIMDEMGRGTATITPQEEKKKSGALTPSVSLEQFKPKEEAALPKTNPRSLNDLYSAVGGIGDTSFGGMLAREGMVKKLAGMEASAADRDQENSRLALEKQKQQGDEWYKNQQLKVSQAEQNRHDALLPHQIEEHKSKAALSKLGVDNYESKADLQKSRLEAIQHNKELEIMKSDKLTDEQKAAAIEFSRMTPDQEWGIKQKAKPQGTKWLGLAKDADQPKQAEKWGAIPRTTPMPAGYKIVSR